ncbi:MAG: hypothetical protein Q4B59_00690 [Lachnospiraceae bacterium]|nr:hypothetical protein [Lachnospiraceae bacterium]
MSQIRRLKKEFSLALASCIASAICLSSVTYAWYVANGTVKMKTATISAQTNGFILQIATMEEGAQHGGEQKSLQAMTTGATLSPASTDNLKDWYVCQSWNNQGYVTDYSVPEFETGDDAVPGKYTVSGKDYHAYIKSDYIIYTINETGTADVYLEDDGAEAPIVVTVKNGDGSSTVTDSLRVAITTQAIDKDGKPVGDETLKIVYSPKNETGKGNDSSAINGWTSIKKNGNSTALSASSYPHFYGTPHTAGAPYADQNGDNWVATQNGENFEVIDGTKPIATNVGYDGVIVHVYIWMEGTDADCVNGKSIENDKSTYDVTVKFAGVSTN